MPATGRTAVTFTLIGGDMATRCTDEYLPWLLAHDYNFSSFEALKSELYDIGDDKFMVLLASRQDSTNILFICDQQWEGT